MMKKFLIAVLAVAGFAAAYAGIQYVGAAASSEQAEVTGVAMAPQNPNEWDLVKAVDYSAAGATIPGGGNFQEATATIEGGALKVVNPTATSNNWDLQYPIIDGLSLEGGVDYRVVVTMSADKDGNMSTWLGNWDGNDPKYGVGFSAAKKEIVLDHTAKNTITDGIYIMQTGSFVGTTNIYKVEVYKPHVNEDAVYDWVEVTAEEHVVKLYKDQFSNQSGAITVVSQAQKEQAWDTQIWFVMDKALDAKTKVKLTFDAKASSAQNLGFGAHGAPDGKNWKAGGVCDAIDVTTEWQTFEREFSAQAGWQSFALDLTKAAEVTYDFKNIKIEAWQEIELVPEVDPALVCGEEEYGLNTHSIVTVESASAITANILNCPQAIGASYNINVMNMGQDEEGIFWSVGQEIAAGEMSLSTVAYAELEKPINFEAGKKYQLAITVYGQPTSDPVEVGTYYFEFAGSYIAPEPIVPAFSELATDTELYLYNVETGAFLLGANDWNTRASVSTSKGYKFQVKANGETYVLSNYVETKNGWYDMFAEGAAGIYVDHASQANWDNWTITSNGDATYQIANKGYANVLFGATDDIAADSRCYLNEKSVNTTWAFVAPADYESYLQAVKDANGYLAVVASSECKAGADELDGKTFVIVDAATCDNLLCNIGDAHDMAAKSLASLDGSEYIYTKFAKVEKDGVEGNLYTMQMFTADGKNFSKWGSNGYVNFQPAGGNIVFSLGLGNAGVYGQDCENGGLWDVQKDGDNYVIRNVARDTYFNPSAASCGTAEKTAVKLFGKAAFVKPEPTPAEIAVLPSLLAGEEEIALNDHSEATVESAEAVAVSFEGVVPFGASYSISTLKQAATAEGTQWVADQKVASGMMSLSGKAYAEFDKTVVFEQGTKYQLEIVWRNVEGIIIGSAQFIINGATAKGIEDGDYVIMNVATGKYLNGANAWGTRASITKHGQIMTLAQLEDGKYTIDSHISNGGASHFLGDNVFVDSPAFGFTLENVGGNVWAIKNGEKYLASNTNNTEVNFDATEATEAAQWVFVSKEDIMAEMASATASAPVDVTAFIGDANFSRNNQYKSLWSMEASNKNLGGGANENMCAESFHSAFTLSQTLENLPNGLYKVYVQGYYRQDGEDTNLPYFFANDATAEFMNVEALGTPAADDNHTVQRGDVFIPNSMGHASNIFAAGEFTHELDVVVTDGTLTLGAKNENLTLWVIWDNFELYYLGEPEEPAEMTVTPSLFAGFEDLEAAYAGELGTEYTLNTHSLVSVDVAEGLHVEVANCPEAIGITFMLNEMLQGQDEDVTFWHVGKELAVGEINMKLDSYAAFEAPITFYAGTKYQLTVTVFAEVNGEPAEISTTTYQFNGASAPVNGSVADGINSIELNSVNGKFIKNGKVVIVKNGKTYNVNGVQVK